MEILLATTNQHKIKELLKILPSKTRGGSKIIYKTLSDFGSVQIEETGTTLEENAILKATSGVNLTGLITIADDTGLMVDALDGAPGVKSARFAYPDRADYSANNEKLLDLLKQVSPKGRKASFTTFVALAFPDGKIMVESGEVKGSIATSYHGSNGFGYDPLFLVTGTSKTMAELTLLEKNQISHRAKAFQKMNNILLSL